MTQPLATVAAIWTLLFAVGGCASSTPPLPVLYPDEALLSGQLVGGQNIPAAPANTRLLALSPEMRALAARGAADRPAEQSRIRGLLREMGHSGYLNARYDTQTLTAAEVFESNSGNCLSYTMLFVALARDVGLDARFQRVEAPPVWNQGSDLVMLDQHVNAVIPNVRMDARFTRDYVVDFNMADYQGNYERGVISDAEAFARFHSNLGVEAMQRGDTQHAFAQFKRALINDSELAAAWTNLGALYRRYDERAALSAYHRALQAEPDNPTALANLAVLHQHREEPDLAAHYTSRVRSHRDKNPYFHYQSSLELLASGDIEGAEVRLAKAMKLKNQEHQFHHLRARLASIRNDRAQVRESLRRARELAEGSAMRARYSDKLKRLGLL